MQSCDRRHPGLEAFARNYTPRGPIRYSEGVNKRTEILLISASNDRLYLAIESGGSGTRLALAGPDEVVLHEARCASASPLYRDPRGFSDAFAATLEDLLGREGVDRGAVAAIGLAGPADAAVMHTTLAAALPRAPRLEHSEGELALARYDITEGIALVAGTGASCHALDAHGARKAIGGYGPQFGDEGSAYWIGREALRAAFKAEQSRIEPTALLDAARNFYRVDSPWQLLDEAGQGGHIPAPRIAAFSAVVDGVAAAEDPRAEAILDEAGTQLGTLILDLAAQTHFEATPVPLVMAGGVFHSSRVAAAIENVLARAPHMFAPHPVVHDPIAGLIHLLQRDITIRTT